MSTKNAIRQMILFFKGRASITSLRATNGGEPLPTVDNPGLRHRPPVRNPEPIKLIRFMFLVRKPAPDSRESSVVSPFIKSTVAFSLANSRISSLIEHLLELESKWKLKD
ncbi:hypothetical protein LINGRAHAP2_LOCUS34034 [Linum grandiflorum]